MAMNSPDDVKLTEKFALILPLLYERQQRLVLVTEIVGVYIRNRDEAVAWKLWNSLPRVYRQRAVAYTDFWTAYGVVFPSKRHQAVGKTGLTS